MKKLLLLAVLTSNSLFGQYGNCINTVTGWLGTTNYPTGILNANTVFTGVANDSWAGDYFFCNVTFGQTYIWSTCASFGGVSSYDDQLTLTDNNNFLLCFSDDFCNQNASIQWTATYTGVVRISLTQYDGLTNQTDTRIVWKVLSSAGIEDSNSNIAKESIKIYPTIVENSLNYTSELSGYGKVQIFDLNNKVLFSEKVLNKEGTIDCSFLNYGTYFISFQNEETNDILILKFIKI